MGAGASVDVQQAVGNATKDELAAAVVELPLHLRKKLEAALKKPPTSEFRRGQDVECRNAGEEWCAGKVFALVPTEEKVAELVKREPDWMPHAECSIASKDATGTKAASAKFVVSNPGMLHEFYLFDMKWGQRKSIGQGSRGPVYKAEEKATGKYVAIKSISKMEEKASSESETELKHNLGRLQREVEIQASLDHPNICKLYETFEDYQNLYLVMELLDGGDLLDIIVEIEPTEKQTAVLMKQALQAALHLKEHGVCHRDIKIENFLFLDNSPTFSIETCPMKLIDFGASCKCAEDQILRTKLGNPDYVYYVAPQVLNGDYDMKCDMWSIGVVLYVLMCGYLPFGSRYLADEDGEILSQADEFAKVLSQVRAGKYSFSPADWKHASDDCKNLIKMCLEINPNERCTPDQALKHAWLSNMEMQESAPADAAFLDRFRQFRSASKVQKVARQAIATRAKESDINKLREMFIALDTDGNGTLTLEELSEAIDKSGLEGVTSDLKDIMSSIGSEGLNRVNYTEFLAATLDEKVYTDTNELWSAFHIFDKNSDGCIDKEELKTMLNDGGGEISKETCIAAQKLITEADRNGDSKIQFDEFVEMVRSSNE